jgi:hypothetical protein
MSEQILNGIDGHPVLHQPGRPGMPQRVEVIANGKTSLSGILGELGGNVRDIELTSVRKAKDITCFVRHGRKELIDPFIHGDSMGLNSLQPVLCSILHHDETAGEIDGAPLKVDNLVVAHYRGNGENGKLAESLVRDRCKEALEFPLS